MLTRAPVPMIERASDVFGLTIIILREYVASEVPDCAGVDRERTKMWPPLVSGLLCLPAMILLLGGWLGNSDIRQRNLTAGFAAGRPPVTQVVSLSISLPPTQLSMNPLPELDAWQVVLSEPPSRGEAQQVPADPTPTAGATNEPPVDLVQPAIYLRSKPAHPAPVRAVRAPRRKDIAVIVASPPPSEPLRRSQIVWVPQQGGG